MLFVNGPSGHYSLATMRKPSCHLGMIVPDGIRAGESFGLARKCFMLLESEDLKGKGTESRDFLESATIL